MHFIKAAGLLVLLVPSSVHAALVCQGTQNILEYRYTFDQAKGKNLAVQITSQKVNKPLPI